MPLSIIKNHRISLCTVSRRRTALRKFWDKTSQHKPLMITSAVLGIVALVIIVGAVWFALQDKATNPVVLDIGGTEIHKDRYDSLVKQGQKYQISADDVRSIIIDYYKNKIAADKIQIEIDPKYPQLTRGQMIGQNLKDTDKKYDFEALSESTDEIATMMIYNTAFDVRMQAIKLGGYSVVVFDFPTAVNPYADKEELKEQTKQDAKELRKKVISGEVTGDAAIKEAARVNSAAGRSSLSGYYFVTDNDKTIGGISGTGIQTFGFLEKYMKTLKQEGISKVSVTQGNDYFFVDYLHYDKANPDIEHQVTSIKNKVRVVQYDK